MITNVKIAKKLDLFSHHKTEIILCDIIQLLANSTIVIILEYINDSNQHIGHLKLTCYISYFKKKQNLQNNNAGNKHG